MIDLKASAVSLFQVFVHIFFRTTRRFGSSLSVARFFCYGAYPVRSRHLRLFVHPIRSAITPKPLYQARASLDCWLGQSTPLS